MVDEFRGGVNMEKIIVSYSESWDCEGYHTTQNVKISKSLFDRFNLFLADCRKLIEKKYLITNEEMNLLLYGHEVKNLDRCLHLTQLDLLYEFLNQNHIECKRIKRDRNTLIIIK